MTTNTTTTRIADEVAAFLPGFANAVGPELTAVFDREQSDLRELDVASSTASVGDQLPAATVTRADGSQASLESLLGDAASVLVFYRGAWCPFCNIALRHYEATLVPSLRERGIPLIAISPQNPDGTAAAVEKGELSYTVVSDQGNALAGELGIVTAPSAEAQQAHTTLGFAVKDSNADGTPAIPYPSVVIVDGSGVIRFIDIKTDYTQRTETAEILSAIDAL